MPTCPTNTRLYQGGKVIAEGFGAGESTAMLERHPDAVLWLDLFDPDMADMAAIQAEFHLHPLAVEDSVHDHQRPKLDRYPGHLFMNVYGVEADTTGPRPVLQPAEISSFITERALPFLEFWENAVAAVDAGTALTINLGDIPRWTDE